MDKAILSVPIESEPTEEPQLEQQATDQATDQTAIMANQQDADPIGQQLKLKLIYSARDQLFTGLNQLSVVLQCDRPLSADVKQIIRKQMEKCIQLLVRLSSKSTPCPEGSSLFDKLAFELTGAERSKIVTYLMNIREVLLCDKSIADETKRGLIAENKCIIDRLLGLPYEVQDEAIASAAGSVEEEDTGEPPSKKRKDLPMCAEVNSDLNERLDRLNDIIKNQGEKIDSFENKMSVMNIELKQEIKNADITRPEALFEFKLADVSKFFKNNKNECHSEIFWCRGLKWSVELSVKVKSKTKYLGVFLHCNHDDWTEWSCQASCTFILYAGDPEKNYCKDGTPNFDELTSFGFDRFICYRDLSDKKNGYLEKDELRLGVELKGEPVFRRRKP